MVSTFLIFSRVLYESLVLLTFLFSFSYFLIPCHVTGFILIIMPLLRLISRALASLILILSWVLRSNHLTNLLEFFLLQGITAIPFFLIKVVIF